MKQTGFRFGVKRCIDVAGATFLGAATAPLLGAAALAIRCNMGPPMFFQQVRIGRHGRPFTLYKLRTMRHGAGDDAQRLTWLGRWLRRTSVDELPQLYNVWRGDMSLVGPRPLLPRYMPRYSAEQARRHHVLPGLTGWTQVKGRNALDWPSKLQLDVWYVDHWSLLLDLHILLRTLAQVCRFGDVGHADAPTMPEFMPEHTP